MVDDEASGATAPAGPQEDTPAGPLPVVNSSRQARPLPAEIREEFFAGPLAEPFVAPAAQNVPVLPAAVPVVRPDLHDEDLEFKLTLSMVGRHGELGCRAVTVACPGGADPALAGSVLAARENMSQQLGTLLNLMLRRLHPETGRRPEKPEPLLAPGPTAVALSPDVPLPDDGAEELVPSM